MREIINDILGVTSPSDKAVVATSGTAAVIIQYMNSITGVVIGVTALALMIYKCRKAMTDKKKSDIELEMAILDLNKKRLENK